LHNPNAHAHTHKHRFRIDNTDHIFDVNKKPNDHDQVDLVCPQQVSSSPGSEGALNRSSSSSNAQPADHSERYVIYSVSSANFARLFLQFSQFSAHSLPLSGSPAGQKERSKGSLEAPKSARKVPHQVCGTLLAPARL